MTTTDELKQLVSSMLMVPRQEIDSGTSLKSLTTSLGSTRLRLGLKRLGVALPAGPTPSNFGALLARIGAGASAPGEEPPRPSSIPAAAWASPSLAGPTDLQVGIDVEDIRSLPEVQDYWEHDFYRNTFSRAEIAYAILQIDPRVHLAGFWCAKEALRKCDHTFTSMDLSRLVVAHEPNGKPYLKLLGEGVQRRLPHGLSISHTSEIATAIVIYTGSHLP